MLVYGTLASSEFRHQEHPTATVNNPLEALRVFCCAAQARNFRDAAQQLAVSPQVVTRVVRELEDTLGEPLFHRSTRGVRLTAFGAQLVERARSALAGVEALFPVRGQPGQVNETTSGLVRVTAPRFLGRAPLMATLAPLLAAHPGLVLDLRLSEVRADVVDQQIDIGVRIGPMRDSGFVARAVAQVHFHVVATPTLVARVGAPQTIAELLDQRPCTAMIDLNNGRPWNWLFRGSRQQAPAVPAFVTDDPEAEQAAVLAGIGFGQLPDFLAQPALREGRLVSVLDAEAPKPWPVHVYRARQSPVPARVRLVFEALVQGLAKLPSSSA